MRTASVAVVATTALLAVGLPAAAPAQAAQAARPVVTQAEYAKVTEGMTRKAVERIFGAGRGCTYYVFDYGQGKKNIGVSYPKAGGGFVRVTYSNTDQPKLRVTGKQKGRQDACKVFG